MSAPADRTAIANNARAKRKPRAAKRKSAASAMPVAADAEPVSAEAGGKSQAAPVRTRRKTERASALETTIGYKFRDKALLERALTHISALKGQGRTGSYQRLEFLGDHVLGLAVSEMLFEAFPKAEEGELSRRLADLVRRESCADVARAIDLGASLRLGASEVRAGGRSRIAILADVCESLVGAVFLDGGYKAAKVLVERYWSDRMRAPARPLRDPKTVLQEWAQARGLPTPSYREVERIGPHHDPVFRVAVLLPEREPAEGHGRSKRAAEQAAAAALLAREGVRADV
ncbi:MAG: ribonuclease III [Pseudorhodoplanes sp.]